MPAGRPRIKLPDNYEEIMLGLAREGASIVELSVALGISRETFYSISERDPIFSDTVKKCKELSEAWWESSGRKNLMNRDFNYTGWYMNMKNRFGWRDRTEQETTIHLPKPIMELGDGVSTNDSNQED